ncbi:hypothetical protein Q9189_004239 [Teloschistes chrysophthalmus]
MASYNKMVSMFAGHEEAAIFRRFDKLNRKTLLYMQAELIHLEAELKQIEIDDGSAPSEDEEKKVDDEKKFEEEEKPRNLSSVYDLKESAGTGNDLQWRKYKEIRGKLQAYNRAHLNYLSLHKVTKPTANTVNFLREWPKRREGGNFFLRGREVDTWEAKDDFFSLDSQDVSQDALASFLTEKLVPCKAKLIRIANTNHQNHFGVHIPQHPDLDPVFSVTAAHEALGHYGFQCITLADPGCSLYGSTGRHICCGDSTSSRERYSRASLDSSSRNRTSSSPSSNPTQSPFLGSYATDRVFPIRSVVSVDPNLTPGAKGGTNEDGFPGMALPKRGTTGSVTGSTPHSRRHSISSVPNTDESVPPTPDSAVAPKMPVGIPPAASSIPGNGGIWPSARARRGSTSQPGGDKERMGGARQMESFIDQSSSRSTKSESMSAVQSNADSTRAAQDDTGGILTARFKHVVTAEGHAVIIGRDGDTLQRCEDEPIHMPGAIQSFGLLVALREEEEGKFKVRMVSENSKKIIGYTPKQLFELDSFCDILTEEQADNLMDHVDFIREEDADPATNGPEVFTLSIRPPTSRRAQKLWCAMHVNEANRDLVICEFELEDDHLNPLIPHGEGTPDLPEDTLNSTPTEQEYAESTVNMSKPLRVLRTARKRKGEAAAMEVFNIMSQVQEQLANAPNLDSFLKILVGVVKELTGFHRVMIYQFDQAWNGRVVTELVDPRATKDLYKGLNFPASDIPKQARDMYKINKVRLLYDRDQETARLVCRTTADLETPLDLTFAYLRAMSPIHIKYLANMAVRASMSISINAFNELWGLIACHSYGSKGMRVSFPIRKMCRLVGDSASRNIERLSYASRLHARKLINTVPTEKNPSGYIIASSDDLLQLFDADYGLLSIRDETKILGKLEQTQEALALLEYLRLRKFSTVIDSVDIQLDFPDLRYSPGFSCIAGLMLVPLSVGGSDFIVFFRKGQLREVKWAGNPYEKFVKEGTEGYLEPRKSFKTWSETVVGKCKEWTEEQTETAAVLCLVYGKFIEVWRQKEQAVQNTQLTRLLLANSAHEVRTPLNAIINYLEIALEGSIDQDTRENLAKSHSASKSLICVINDLLDLTKTEAGQNLIKDDLFDFPATVKEATEMFLGDAKRKQIKLDVISNDGIPQQVVGDQRRVRQAISNVTANAIQHTSNGSVRVETCLTARTEDRVDIDIILSDTGCGMSSSKLDALFRELEQVQSESDESLAEKLGTDSKAITSKKDEERTLGLGLAVVARIIRNMNGQLRLKSEEGKGSRVVMQMNFGLPAEESYERLIKDAEAAEAQSSGTQPITPPVEKGEILLVNKSAQKNAPSTPAHAIVRRPSNDSIASIKSKLSVNSVQSARSDVDRLIEAIQEPSMKPKSATTDGVARRPLSSRRSSTRSRPQSAGTLVDEPIQMDAGPGEAAIYDSKTPVRSIRVPGSSYHGTAAATASRTPSRVLFDVPNRPQSPPNTDHLNVLVAEDDPVNSKIMKKRLERVGHNTHLTVNGEDCSSAYGDNPSAFDVVLMDMQMPIVDGLTSTKMIRSFEKSHPEGPISSRAALNGRIPIFAVSASLLEREREKYVNAGFDGWILKPIDFQRLGVLLRGIVEEQTRESCLYRPGQWEHGGWFLNKAKDVFDAATTPSTTAPVSTSEVKSHPPQPSNDPISKEQERLDSLDDNAVHAKSLPDDPGGSGNVDKSSIPGAASLPQGGPS